MAIASITAALSGQSEGRTGNNGRAMIPIAIVIIALLSMFVSACPSDTYEPAKTGTSLIINNLSDYPLISVEYSSVDFGTIKSGRDATKEINYETKYIFF
jgi:hypothetical protein